MLFQSRIKLLSQRDVRSRLVLYLSQQATKSENFKFKLHHSKTEIADLIAVARPSVSRELKHMQEDGLIILDREFVTIINKQAFNLSN